VKTSNLAPLGEFMPADLDLTLLNFEKSSPIENPPLDAILRHFWSRWYQMMKTHSHASR